MNYLPPDLGVVITLSDGYTPPALDAPVVLCGDTGEPPADGGATLYVEIPPSAPGATLGAVASLRQPAALVSALFAPTPTVAVTLTEQPPRAAESIWSKAPLHRPAVPGAVIHTDQVQALHAAITPPAIALDLTFRGRERAYLADLHVVTLPLLIVPTPAISAHMLPTAHVAVTAAPIAPTPTAQVDLRQALDLPDADGPGVRAPSAQLNGQAASALAVAQQQMLHHRTAARAGHHHGLPRTGAARLPHQSMLTRRRLAGLPHAHGPRITARATAPHADTLRTRRPVTAPHAQAIALRTGTRAPHAEQIRTRNRLQAQHARSPRAAQGLTVGHHNALRTVARLEVRWTHADWPKLGRWWPFYQPPSLGAPVVLVCPYTPRPLSCPVVLHWYPIPQPPCPEIDDPDQPGATVVIPVLEYYLVINTFSLVRASDNEPIEVDGFSASIDADSWTWGWSATLHADLMPLVRSPALGEHVELIATLNGTPLRLVVERMGRDRRFADARLRISGRGRAAWLADPHSPIITRHNTEQRTAQQLLTDALTTNGVPIGWSVDWRITDWQVPAGAWSHTGTYMDAAARIAEAGGAYVQAHNTDQTLIILPRYPAAPWAWSAATPDIQLPEDVVEVEGIEWQDKPAYNAVWVAGGEGGRLDRILRTGTAADRYAQSIVDPLATAPEMTRQRGLAVLGDTGRQAHISLRLPVLPEGGIIQPGQLVRYTENGVQHIGLSRAVTVQHKWPQLWQTVRVETHELEPI